MRLRLPRWITSRSGPQRSADRTRRWLVVAGLASLTLSFGAVFGKGGYLERLKYEAEHVHLEQEIAALERGVAALESDIAQLEKDPAAYERLAREELGLAKPGEVLVLLVPGDRASLRGGHRP